MADVELLPLPEGELAGEMRWGAQVYGRDEMHAYARANVAHAVAPLQAEIDALRAEVERANSWNERVSVCRDHVADIVDGPCVICALYAAEARAERLAEALRAARQIIVTENFPIGWSISRIDEVLTSNAAQQGETT